MSIKNSVTFALCGLRTTNKIDRTFRRAVNVYLVDVEDKGKDLDTMINAFLIQNDKHVNQDQYGVFNMNVYNGKTVWIVMEKFPRDEVSRITVLPPKS